MNGPPVSTIFLYVYIHTIHTYIIAHFKYLRRFMYVYLGNIKARLSLHIER